MTRICFEAEDLHDELPPPGGYRARISTARFKKSAGGNRMFQVVYAIEDVAPSFERVAEYFVLDGESRYAIVLAKRSLVDLYRACGLSPKPGDVITPADLLGALLEVQIGHDDYNERPRLRVVGHHRLGTSTNRLPF